MVTKVSVPTFIQAALPYEGHGRNPAFSWCRRNRSAGGGSGWVGSRLAPKVVSHGLRDLTSAARLGFNLRWSGGGGALLRKGLWMGWDWCCMFPLGLVPRNKCAFELAQGTTLFRPVGGGRRITRPPHHVKVSGPMV